MPRIREKRSMCSEAGISSCKEALPKRKMIIFVDNQYVCSMTELRSKKVTKLKYLFPTPLTLVSYLPQIFSKTMLSTSLYLLPSPIVPNRLSFLKFHKDIRHGRKAPRLRSLSLPTRISPHPEWVSCWGKFF